MPESIARAKSFAFALKIMGLHKKMTAQNEFVISKQLLRSGTSIGANVQEALAAQSRKDFLHKMSIASKEARESMYWLELLHASGWLKHELKEYMSDAGELVRILTAIVKTAGGQKAGKTKN